MKLNLCGQPFGLSRNFMSSARGSTENLIKLSGRREYGSMMQFVTNMKRSGRLTTLNLNRASYRELIRLPGIGDTLAKRIIEHRQRYGCFRCVEDLVHSIGLHQRRFEQIIDRVEV